MQNKIQTQIERQIRNTIISISKSTKNISTDHLGNKFPSVSEMCERYYGRKKSRRQIVYGKGSGIFSLIVI